MAGPVTTGCALWAPCSLRPGCAPLPAVPWGWGPAATLRLQSGRQRPGGARSSLCLGVIVWRPQPHLAPAASCLGPARKRTASPEADVYLQLGLLISKVRKTTEGMGPLP